VATFKRDVTSEIRRRKDRLVDNGKEAARSRADDVIESIKAKVAANPGAALAIGAGLAWRFYRHPPVTPLLVGAGLTALLRTDPKHPRAGSDVAARAAALARSAGDRVREWPESPAADHLRDLASYTKQRIVELGTSERERLGGPSESATGAARHGLSDTVLRSRSFPSTARTALQGALTSEQRDTYLLGFAAVALAAAVGMAAARGNQHERPEQRASRPAVIRKRPNEGDGKLAAARDAPLAAQPRPAKADQAEPITAD
jgi:hypothetical protein